MDMARRSHRFGFVIQAVRPMKPVWSGSNAGTIWRVRGWVPTSRWLPAVDGWGCIPPISSNLGTA